MAERVSKGKMIENKLLDGIRNGTYAPGDKIPTEMELCNEFGVSRMTVNKVLQSLADREIIIRKPGKGSYVRTPVFSKHLGLDQGFSDDMRDQGLIPESEVILFEKKTPVEFEAVKDNNVFSKARKLCHFIRIRKGSGMITALNETYIDAQYLPGLKENILRNSLYEYMNKKGVKADKVQWKIYSTVATKEQADMMQVPKNTVLLACLKRSYIKTENNDYRCLEMTYSYYNSSVYSYEFEVNRSGNSPSIPKPHMNL